MLLSWIARVCRIPSRPSRRSRRTAQRSPLRTFRPSLEALEARTLLSATLPVSISTSPSTMGDGPSSIAARAISANGQYEVFSSSANNLVSGLTISPNSTNVYQRNLTSGTTSLVSINTAGKAGVLSGDYAAAPAITADGRYIAFVSDYDNLTGNGNTGFSPELFVRDMAQGKTYLVSSGYDGSYSTPSIAESNGQLAISYSADSNNNEQVYVATLQLNSSTGDIQSSALKTTLVSANSSGQGANSTSEAPVLSKDGSTVTFNSFATNLNVPGGYSDDNSWVENLYLYSLSSKTLKLLSAEPTTGTNATGNQSSAITELNLPGAVPANSQTVSSNGQYVVFTSSSDNMIAHAATFIDTSNVYRRDLKAGTTQLVSISTSGTGVGGYAFDPIITSNGRYIAFFSEPSYGTYDHGLTSNDIRGGFFVRDMTQGQTYMVSNAATTADTFEDGGPSIGETSNGQLVIAYEVADTSSNSQIYVSTLNLNPTTGDIESNTLKTKLVSATSSNSGGNASSFLPQLSSDGSTLAFVSAATNLNGEKGDGYNMLFAYNVAAGKLSQVSPVLQSNTSVNPVTISVSDHGDIAYALASGSGTGTPLYTWNAGTGKSTAIPLVLYPQKNGAVYGGIGIVAISGDGSTVAFEEYNVYGQGYIFAASNWQSGTPTDTQVSQTVGSALNGDTVWGSGDPSISDNGKVISYVLLFNKSNLYEAFVSNNGTITEVSPAYSGGNSNGNAGPVAVSSDGSTAVFNSVASNLFSKATFGLTPGQSQVYAYSVASKTVSLVSAKAPGLFTADNTTTDTWGNSVDSASLSDTGRYVAFTSEANDLLGSTGNNAYAEDVQKGVPTLISGFGPDNNGDYNTQQAVVSGDGSTVAYANLGEGQIYSRNWRASSPTTTLVSVNSSGTGGGNSTSADPNISDNGQVIAFETAANNLTGNDADTKGYEQVFVRSLATKKTILASPNSSGTDGGNGASQAPILSADGSRVVFNSQATNLVSGVAVPSTSTENVYAFTLASSSANVSGEVSVTKSSLQYNAALGEYSQTATIKNTGGATLHGPLALQLTNLSSNVTLANASGTWLGDPYIHFESPSGQLAAGQSISVTLYFKAPANSSISYGTEVWQNV